MKKDEVKKRTLNMPAPPKDWNTLSKEQLLGIHKLLNEGLSEVEYKLKVFLMLMGLKILKRAEKKNDGTFRYLFRRLGWKHTLRKETLGMESWEVSYWIDKYLKFLDEPFRLLKLPFEYVIFRGRKYRAPEPLMINLTYEQYGNAQKYLVNYWELSRMVDSLRKNGATTEAIRHVEHEALNARAGFLAHMYTPASLRILDQRHRGTRFAPRWVYNYDSDESERHLKKFRTAPRWMFDVTYQLFQSCQQNYKKDFKFLFKEYEDGEGKSALVMEIETINAVQKYAGYGNQQEVYDTNAVFIFGFLNNMAHEAQEIEKMNNRMKLKR